MSFAITEASALLEAGTYTSFIPFLYAEIIRGNTPFTCRTPPSSPNSPKNQAFSIFSGAITICLLAIKNAIVIGKSYKEPSFFKLAGARDTIVFLLGGA